MADDGDANDVRRPRKRRRRLGRALVAVALIAALTPAALSLRAQRKVERRLAAYRAAGEPASVADLGMPAVANEDNAVPDLKRAAEQVDAYRSRPEWVTYLKEGDGLPLTPAERAVLRRAMEDNREALERVAAATAKPGFDWANPPTSPLLYWLLPELSGQRALAEFLSKAAWYDHDRGDDLSAISRVEKLLFVARAMDHHPRGQIIWLVGRGIRESACNRILDLAPDLKLATASDAGRGGAVPPERVRRLIDELLDERDAVDVWRRTVLAERVYALDMVQTLLDGRADRSGRETPSGGPRPLPAGVLWYVWGAARYDDLLAAFDALTDLSTAADAPDWPPARARAHRVLDLSSDAGWKEHPWGGLLVASWDRSLRWHYSSLVDRRLAAVALAARWYAVEHDGRLPPSLDALVPRYLPAVPTDPFVGGGGGATRLRYVPEEPDPRVYSVGWNGVDDGGSDAMPDEANPVRRAEAADDVGHLRRQPRGRGKRPTALKD